jgi:phosphoribulokinase
MSTKHPIISVTGSSGAGTTSVRYTFEQIFRREKVKAVYIEGDAFHRYDRLEMWRMMAAEAAKGDHHFSHFGPESNLFGDLESVFREYGEDGTGRTRHYVHDAVESEKYGGPAGTFTDINFQRIPTVDTSNPFIARWIPTPDESMVVIRFRNTRGFDFCYLLSMIQHSFMSRSNSIVIPGGKLDLAMQIILTPLILQLVERKRRAA